MIVAPESIASLRGEDVPLIQIKRSARIAISACTSKAGQVPAESYAGNSVWVGYSVPQ